MKCRIFVAATIALCVCCSHSGRVADTTPDTGGGSTEITNALVKGRVFTRNSDGVDSSIVPAASATVGIYAVQYIPFAKGSSYDSSITDSGGRYLVEVHDTGSFNVVMRAAQNMTGFTGRIHLEQSDTVEISDTVESAGAVAGTLIPDTAQPGANAVVYIPGTPFFAPVDTSNAFILCCLPADSLNLKIASTGEPVAAGAVELFVAYDTAVAFVAQSADTVTLDTIRLNKGADTTIPPDVHSGMKLIPAGTFSMGLVSDELGKGLPDEEPAHTVSIAAFWMDSAEVSGTMFEELVGYLPARYPGKEAVMPATAINWFEAILFCNERSKRSGLDTVYSYSSRGTTDFSGMKRWTELTGLLIDYAKHGYRLPTEAEWEYAARAGNDKPFYWIGVGNSNWYSNDTANLCAWYLFNTASQQTPDSRGTKRPNAWGLYDMHGNAMEWCNDWYAQDYYRNAPSQEPTGPDSGTLRVLRGGSWSNSLDEIRVSARYSGPPDNSDDMVHWNVRGFRTVLPDK
jgi:formylglycine-generating enzyme required for sulfatase activity